VLTRFQVESPAIWVMYPQNRHLTPRVRALVDFLVEWGRLNRF
jgi:DNA-binding transcriptional LysR family regulator